MERERERNKGLRSKQKVPLHKKQRYNDKNSYSTQASLKKKNMNKNNIGRSLRRTQVPSWKRSKDWNKNDKSSCPTQAHLKNKSKSKNLNFIDSNLYQTQVQSENRSRSKNRDDKSSCVIQTYLKSKNKNKNSTGRSF